MFCTLMDSQRLVACNLKTSSIHSWRSSAHHTCTQIVVSIPNADKSCLFTSRAKTVHMYYFLGKLVSSSSPLTIGHFHIICWRTTLEERGLLS